MDEQEYIKENLSFNRFGDNSVLLQCGHGRSGEYIIRLRQDDPEVNYICCHGCYHMILGDMIERAFTIKQR